MICELCSNDRLLTYRSQALRLNSVCAPCIREKFPYTLGTRDEDLRTAVSEALFWLLAHPRMDHVDAAFAVVADPTRRPSPSDLGGRRWPEFVDAVKQATQNWELVS